MSRVVLARRPALRPTALAVGRQGHCLIVCPIFLGSALIDLSLSNVGGEKGIESHLAAVRGGKRSVARGRSPWIIFFFGFPPLPRLVRLAKF